jgi:hypothetical protein
MLRETSGAEVNLLAFKPLNTCLPIKYPRSTPELKATPAAMIPSPVITSRAHAEWWLAVFRSSTSVG